MREAGFSLPGSERGEIFSSGMSAAGGKNRFGGVRMVARAHRSLGAAALLESRLEPGEARRGVGQFPEASEVECVPDGPGDFQDDLAGVADEFCGDIEHGSSDSGRIGGNRHRRFAHVLGEGREQFLVEEPGVHTNKKWNLGPVMSADQLDHRCYHLHRVVTMVGVLFAAPKLGVHDEAAPGELQRLVTFHLLVGRLHPFALLGFIIVHHHGVEAEDHDRGRFQLEPPQEQLPQELSEEEGLEKIEGPEKALDLMRAQELVGGGFEEGGIGGVIFQAVEVDEVAAGPLGEKAEKLNEILPDREALFVFAEPAEQPGDWFLETNAAEVSREQGQPAPSGEGVVSGFDAGDFGLVWGGFRGILCHVLSPPFGLNSWLMSDFSNDLFYHRISPKGGLFIGKNRSI